MCKKCKINIIWLNKLIMSAKKLSIYNIADDNFDINKLSIAVVIHDSHCNKTIYEDDGIYRDILLVTENKKC